MEQHCNIKTNQTFSISGHHEKDFGVKAELNFFALSHGKKNACDDVGGTVKRLAALPSLRMVCNNQIMTPRQLYDWAKDNITNINFLYSTTEAYEVHPTFFLFHCHNKLTDTYSLCSIIHFILFVDGIS